MHANQSEHVNLKRRDIKFVLLFYLALNLPSKLIEIKRPKISIIYFHMSELRDLEKGILRSQADEQLPL